MKFSNVFFPSIVDSDTVPNPAPYVEGLNKFLGKVQQYNDLL